MYAYLLGSVKSIIHHSQSELATATIINVSWVIDFSMQEYKIGSMTKKIPIN